MSSTYGNVSGQITVPEHPDGVSIQTSWYPAGAAKFVHNTLPFGQDDNDAPLEPDGPREPEGPCGAGPVHTPNVASDPDGPRGDDVNIFTA